MLHAVSVSPPPKPSYRGRTGGDRRSGRRDRRSCCRQVNRFGRVTGHPGRDRPGFVRRLHRPSTHGRRRCYRRPDQQCRRHARRPVSRPLRRRGASAVEVNLYGIADRLPSGAAEMVERRGQIINIASVAGVVAVPGQALYSAASSRSSKTYQRRCPTVRAAGVENQLVLRRSCWGSRTCGRVQTRFSRASPAIVRYREASCCGQFTHAPRWCR